MDASRPIPTELNKFIRISLDDKLSDSEKRRWYKIVETFKVIAPRPMLGTDGNVVLIHKKMDSRHVYDIPLKRDLTENEIKNILEQWDNYFKIKDFIVEASHGDIEKQKQMLSDAMVVKDDSYEQLCEAIAKTQHTVWMHERIDNGWRYGEKPSSVSKTHPMLRPWHELPEKYKNIDLRTPQVFLEELKRMGFTVVKSVDLNNLIESINS